MADGDDHSAPPTRLMNFVSEQELEEAKRTRGSRVEDGTAQRDKSLYEVLKENKDKKDAEFNERFKHRPPKALDEDETEFLDSLEMSRREYEQQVADEESQELQRFQAAVEAQSGAIFEPKEIPSVPRVQDEKLPKKKKSSHPSGIVIKVKPQAKKAKREQASSETTEGDKLKTPSSTKASSAVRMGSDPVPVPVPVVNITGSLVSYSDGSEDEE